MDELVLRKYSGNDKIKTIQTLRELFALDLSEAKEIVDDLSSGTEKIMQTENGSKAITELKAVGILAEFLKDNEAATLSDDVVESMGREELITHLEAAIKCIQTLNSIQEAINEQISNFAQTYPTNLKASSNEALLFMRRYRFANCSCFSCCFKDAYPSSNVQ